MSTRSCGERLLNSNLALSHVQSVSRRVCFFSLCYCFFTTLCHSRGLNSESASFICSCNKRLLSLVVVESTQEHWTQIHRSPNVGTDPFMPCHPDHVCPVSRMCSYVHQFGITGVERSVRADSTSILPECSSEEAKGVIDGWKPLLASDWLFLCLLEP